MGYLLTMIKNMTANDSKTKFSEKENETIERLIQLGDSKELAEKTVIRFRRKSDNTSFYRFAYES